MRTKKIFLKKLAITVIICIYGTIVFGQKTLFITEKSGSVKSFSVNEIRKLTFPNGNLTVSKNDGSYEIFPIDAVAVLKFAGPVSIEKNTIENTKALLYPNPVKDHFNLSFECYKAVNADILIFDINGKLLINHNVETIVGKNIIDLNIGNLVNGMYLCSLRYQGNTINLKFNINR
jgi:hypothetical protein